MNLRVNLRLKSLHMKNILSDTIIINSDFLTSTEMKIKVKNKIITVRIHKSLVPSGTLN